MALQLIFSPGTACGGGAGQHFEVTITAGAQSITIPITKNQLFDAPSRDELEAFCMVLLRLICRQLADRSTANVRTKLASKIVELSVVG